MIFIDKRKNKALFNRVEKKIGGGICYCCFDPRRQIYIFYMNHRFIHVSSMEVVKNHTPRKIADVLIERYNYPF